MSINQDIQPKTDLQPSQDDTEMSKSIFGFMRSRTVDLIGIGITLSSGVIAAWNATRVNFYKNISRYAQFKDLKDSRDIQYSALLEKYKHTSPSNGAMFRAEFNEISREHTKEVDKLLNHLGVNNLWSRFNTLKSHQIAEVTLTFVGVTSIVLGIAASVSASRRSEDRQHEVHKKLQELVNKLDNQIAAQNER